MLDRLIRLEFTWYNKILNSQQPNFGYFCILNNKKSSVNWTRVSHLDAKFLPLQGMHAFCKISLTRGIIT